MAIGVGVLTLFKIHAFTFGKRILLGTPELAIFPIVTYPHYSVILLNEQTKTRILVIDNEESVRYAVDAVLEFLGDYEVNFAEDGIQGIQLLIDLDPNLVLVDPVSPSANEMDVLEEALA
tara:strand:- start:236 stop:595 length:360 start_codon:yes stop_codon:yes gene_type:complete